MTIIIFPIDMIYPKYFQISEDKYYPNSEGPHHEIINQIEPRNPQMYTQMRLKLNPNLKAAVDEKKKKNKLAKYKLPL